MNTEVQEAPVAAPTPAPAPAPKVVDRRNDVTRPSGDGLTARVWNIIDRLVTASGTNTFPALKDVKEAGAAEGLNAATVTTQYARYRKYLGMTNPRPAKVVAAAGDTVEGEPGADVEVVPDDETPEDDEDDVEEGEDDIEEEDGDDEEE